MKKVFKLICKIGRFLIEDTIKETWMAALAIIWFFALLSTSKYSYSTGVELILWIPLYLAFLCIVIAAIVLFILALIDLINYAIRVWKDLD